MLPLSIYLLLYGLSWVQAITIREDYTKTTTYPPLESSTYRLSVAKSQNPSQRVPNHLQRVRNGFVYEDADDVIHVIEPPKHFQQLKILMQNRPKHLWEQSVKVRPARPPIAPRKPQRNVRTTRKPLERDLEIQETEHLPVEILASVRKTENYLRKHKPKLPLAQQRVKTKKIQTVIWEKGQEQQQLVQGHEQKFQGMREFHNNNRRKFIKKRIKRQTPLAYHPLKGEDLLEHINELVKNASVYLENLKSYENSGEADEHRTTTLHGELVTGSSATSNSNSHPSSQLREEDVIKILENSVKATDVIMEQIKSQTNFSNIPSKCEYARDDRRDHIKSLRQQIHCMQDVIQVMKTTKTPERQRQRSTATQAPPKVVKAGNRFGERLDDRTAKDLRQKPFLVATLDEDYFEDSSPSPLNTSLIYDDVMTTIRNLLQATNLQNLEDSTASSSSSASDTTPFESISLWDDFTTLPQDNSQEPVDFHNLNQYLNSLQTIVANLPQPTNSSLNLHEIEGKASKYYFINPEGGIYNLPQPFQHKDQRPVLPPSSIFRQFPDLPSISEYLNANGNPLKASQNVIEIL